MVFLKNINFFAWYKKEVFKVNITDLFFLNSRTFNKQNALYPFAYVFHWQKFFSAAGAVAYYIHYMHYILVYTASQQDLFHVVAFNLIGLTHNAI